MLVSLEFLIPVIIVSFFVLSLAVVILLVLAFIFNRRKLKTNYDMKLQSRSNTYSMFIVDSLSNPATLGICQSVLIRGVDSFQGYTVDSL